MTQKVWIVTELQVPEYSADRQQCWLQAKSYCGAQLKFSGTAAQMINIRSLQNQQLPVALMLDNCVLLGGVWQVAQTAMLGLLPIVAADLQAMIDQGKAAEWLARQG